MSIVSTAPLPLEQARAQFPRVSGYLSACTAGLPTEGTVTAMTDFTRAWATGNLDPVLVAAQLSDCREAYARIAGVAADSVAVGSQTSQLVSVIAASLPVGSEVLCVTGDFASLTHPFEQQQHRGVRVTYAPLAQLAEAITPATALVAFSLVQSATGEVAPHEEITAAAHRNGALTLADLTQSLGWLPVPASLFDYAVCHAYKWLCAPRGTAFLTVREELIKQLVPIAAGWCSADDVWSSCYAGNTPLAPTAARFDLSPVWPLVGGTLAALQFVDSLDPYAVQAHNLELANAARTLLGARPGNSAIVTWADQAGTDLAALQAAGITASGRAGNARIAFHLWNTWSDVELLELALRR